MIESERLNILLHRPDRRRPAAPVISREGRHRSIQYRLLINVALVCGCLTAACVQAQGQGSGRVIEYARPDDPVRASVLAGESRKAAPPAPAEPEASSATPSQPAQSQPPTPKPQADTGNAPAAVRVRDAEDYRSARPSATSSAGSSGRSVELVIGGSSTDGAAKVVELPRQQQPPRR